ncbi:MAG TPA: 5-oxoprolinase subunit PxpA [bacterium]|nr:5-oxoprolinase subunit PxpA [bacterium]
MLRIVDFNCDLGESFGAYTIGADAEMMGIVTSANVACGFHGGDPLVMERTVRLAREHGVGIGAHPGFPDLAGFGRREMRLSPDELRTAFIYQIGALTAFAHAQGTSVQHVKGHGALQNTAAYDETLSRAIVEAVASVDRRLIIVAFPDSVLARVARDAGLAVAREAFGDRGYTRNGKLVSRSHPLALVTDPEAVAHRVLRIATEGIVETVDGGEFRLEPDTICFHGDTPSAPALARAARDVLARAGVRVAPLGQWLTQSFPA